MVTITVPKKEYERLKMESQAYRRVASKVFEGLVNDSIEDVVGDFRKTNVYTEDFLRDLKSGLKKSSYAKKHGSKTTAPRS